MDQTSVTSAIAREILDTLRTEAWANQLREIRRVRVELDALEAEAVEVARANGYSWAEVATAMGCSKNNAYRKFRA